MSDSITVQSFTGEGVAQYIPNVARLRIEVFREFPYLYAGSMEYEEKYLQTYINSPESVIVIAFDAGQVIGASTAVPMRHETEDFKRPFIEHGIDPESVFYLGESVLKQEYRGRGIGVRFFQEREAHAQRIGDFSWAAFCAVVRPENHPLRPFDYVPLDQFWNKRGYTRHLELQTTLTWQDIDEPAQTPKPMVYWLKALK